MMREPRAYQRFNVDGRLRVKHAGGSVEADLVNISFGGAGLSGVANVSVGSSLTFEFATPLLETSFAGAGIVRHVHRVPDLPSEVYRFGLEFTTINKDALVHLLGRIQAKTADSLRARNNIRPIDYIPY